MSKSQPIKLIDRKTGEICTETVLGGAMLNFAYNTLLGRSLWGLLFRTVFLSRLMGFFYDSGLSKNSIKGLLKNPGFHPEEAEREWQTYRSFNDYFARHLKPDARPIAVGNDILISPADGRLLVYPDISPKTGVPVKGAVRTLEALCGMPLPEERYSVAVIRLAPIDYHRFHYPCDCCDTGNALKIKGKYHSVNPVAFSKAPDLFVENTRIITPLNSPAFGNFYYLEVGAFGVGSIIGTASSNEHKKADEKGFFKFGGSTVILIMPSNSVIFDRDLIENSAGKLETLIHYGEKIASSAKS